MSTPYSRKKQEFLDGSEIFADAFPVCFCCIHLHLTAFTETIKKYTPQRVDVSYAALNRCFGLNGNRPELGISPRSSLHSWTEAGLTGKHEAFLRCRASRYVLIFSINRDVIRRSRSLPDCAAGRSRSPVRRQYNRPEAEGRRPSAARKRSASIPGCVLYLRKAIPLRCLPR